MNDPRTSQTGLQSWWKRRWVRWTGGTLLVLLAGLFVAAEYLAHHLEPLVRKRIVATVSERFGAPVELDGLSISAVSGLEVRATGLRVGYPQGMGAAPDDLSKRAMVRASEITFHTNFHMLLEPVTRLSLVTIEGLEIHIPPAGQRFRPGGAPLPLEPARTPSLVVSNIDCRNATVSIDTETPGKTPLEFLIHSLKLTDVDWTRAFSYDATLTNPRPTGEIAVHGRFGPWQQLDPRATPIDGKYNFTKADLGSIRGIGGTLSSFGHFGGQLGFLTIDGTTDTPNFTIDTANHPMPLHSRFHATVDGTTGDTTLDAVEARLGHSDLVAKGRIVRVKGKGHDTQLSVTTGNARIEDFLALAVKTEPPLLRAGVALTMQLHIPPGPVRVAEKIQLGGRFHLRNVVFSNAKIQDKVDGLSLRAQGHPEEAGHAFDGLRSVVASDMSAEFDIRNALMSVDNLDYQIPGATVQMNGVYSLNGQVFEFKGHVKTQAAASEMVTGWKALLLMPFDKRLRKNGAGMELPVSISGTGNEPHFGLAFADANESTADMAKDIRGKALKPPPAGTRAP